MHIEYPIFLIHRTGSIFRLDTPEEAAEYRYSFKTKHRDVFTSYDYRNVLRRYVTENDWIARDALGQIVVADDIPRKPRRPARWLRHLGDAAAAAEKGLPIPGTGRAGGYRRYRSIARQIKARAEEAGVKDDLRELGLEAFRFNRCFRHNPIDWDSPVRCKDRGWKTQRNTRWKP